MMVRSRVVAVPEVEEWTGHRGTGLARPGVSTVTVGGAYGLGNCYNSDNGD